MDDKRKEILYYWAIRLWSPQEIASMRGQSDRNIRKVYNKMIEEFRQELFKRLYPRYEAYLPLTFAQIIFVEERITKYGEGQLRNRKEINEEGIDGKIDEL